MTAAILEPRPLYAIGTVARLTGLKPDTLRVWERRYGLGASHKSPSGRRQYTQADLEHLQLVAELVKTGTRIGEIASAGRKTLEIMLRRNGDPGTRLDAGKPSVLFVGTQLCRWIDEHQGCLASVSARLARVDLAAAGDVPDSDVGPIEMLVIGCESLGFVQLQQIQALAERLQAPRVLVSCEQPRERAVATLAQQGVATTSFPPAPGFLAFEVARCAAEEAGDQPGDRLGALLREKPREFSAEELARPRDNPFGASNGDLKRGLELDADAYHHISTYCADKNIQWFASCWDEASVDFIEQFQPPAYKLASASLTDDALLRHHRRMGRPIILSTGMSTLEQVDHAVDVLGTDDLVILHTTSAYPAKVADLNLAMIPKLRERYGVPVGYSGHEVGLAASFAAVALGACMVERHITLDRAMWGSDQAASVEPQGLMKLVRDIRTIQIALGDGEKRITADEVPVMKKLRRVG